MAPLATRPCELDLDATKRPFGVLLASTVVESTSQIRLSCLELLPAGFELLAHTVAEALRLPLNLNFIARLSLLVWMADDACFYWPDVDWVVTCVFPYVVLLVV